MSVTPPTPEPLRTTRPSMTPASTTGMSRLRNRLGPGTMLVRANSGTRRGDSSESESMLTMTGSNGTRSQTRYAPAEAVRADSDPTSTRPCTIASSPASRLPLAFRSRYTRPDSPERSSEGPGATPTRSVRRFHRLDPCTNCVAVTGCPGGAEAEVTLRRAEKYDVMVTVYVGPASPRCQWAPTSTRTPRATGCAANADQDTRPAWRSTSVLVRSSV